MRSTYRPVVLREFARRELFEPREALLAKMPVHTPLRGGCIDYAQLLFYRFRLWMTITQLAANIPKALTPMTHRVINMHNNAVRHVRRIKQLISNWGAK
jgi:hypothetical protein